MKRFLLLVAVIAVVFGALLVSLWVLDLIKMAELQNDLRKNIRRFGRGRRRRGLDLVPGQDCTEGIARPPSRAWPIQMGRQPRSADFPWLSARSILNCISSA